MNSWVFIFLMGAMYTCSKVPVLGDVYMGELLMEHNSTLDDQTILSVLKTSGSLQPDNTCGVNYTVTDLQITAESCVTGGSSDCRCSTGYTWSNEMCYNYNCCNSNACLADVSNVTAHCVPEVNVKISGSIQLTSDVWNAENTTQLQTALQRLNGFLSLNITQSAGKRVYFRVMVNTRVETSRLQAIVNSLESDPTTEVTVETYGMVTIKSPNGTVCYKSSPVLKCTTEEAMGGANWKQNQSIELNPGSVVKLEQSCSTAEYGSCSVLTLQNVTSAWVGTYKCGFTIGSVTHTASAQLDVSLLPDVILMEISPLTADCSQNQTIVPVNVYTTVPQSPEHYEVWWSYSGTGNISMSYSPSGSYTFIANISCQKLPNEQYVNVTFRNAKGQKGGAQVNIPVIYAGKKPCSENDSWPKTPAGVTLVNRTCAGGRVGYRSRTCNGPDWQPVYDYCVNQQLQNILNQAQDFQKGLGATQEKAMDIFQRLSNSTSNSSLNVADISASINILKTMAEASNNMAFESSILPNFLTAASNVVNNDWNATNASVLYDMSSTYLHSVEDLVKNTNVNESQVVNSTNLELKSCIGNDCSLSVFDVGVNMKKTNGTLKAVAVKNLMNKLYNNYNDTDPSSLLLVATLQDNNDSSLKIRMDFPDVQQADDLCVFWNTTNKDWSHVGCFHTTNNGKHTCECHHLTSFSVLLSKHPRNDTVLHMITIVGLGVSIFSLLIFLTVEGLVWSAVVNTNLAHFRHTAMVNIATFLLLADISFLASMSLSILPDSWCLILTICKHLFYLAMFCWTLCLSVMLVHQLIFVFNPLRKRVFMVFSGIVGYIVPVLIVGSSYVYYKYNGKSYSNESCWLVYEGLLSGSIHSFLLPVGTIVFANLFCMTVIIAQFVKSSVPDANKANDKVTTKGVIKVLAVLMPLFGITWIIAYINLALPEERLIHEALEFGFTVLNSFQGFFILVTESFTEQKVHQALYKRIMSKSNEKPDSTKHLTSATCTKSK